MQKYGNIAAILSVFIASIGAPTVTSATSMRVEAGASAKVDAHGLCRMVNNGGSNPILVPYMSASEWSTGSNSFTNNIGGMAAVSLAPCTAPICSVSKRQPEWGDYYSPTYRHEYGVEDDGAAAEQMWGDQLPDRFLWNGVEVTSDTTWTYVTGRFQGSQYMWDNNMSDDYDLYMTGVYRHTPNTSINCPAGSLNRASAANKTAERCSSSSAPNSCNGTASYGVMPSITYIYNTTATTGYCLNSNYRVAEFQVRKASTPPFSYSTYNQYVVSDSIFDQGIDRIIEELEIIIPPSLQNCVAQIYLYDAADPFRPAQPRLGTAYWLTFSMP